MQHVFAFLIRVKLKNNPPTKSAFSSLDIQDPLQTTSQYLIRQAETTVDEETLPGKLPETPLRIEPPSSYKVGFLWWWWYNSSNIAWIKQT